MPMIGRGLFCILGSCRMAIGGIGRLGDLCLVLPLLSVFAMPVMDGSMAMVFRGVCLPSVGLRG